MKITNLSGFSKKRMILIVVSIALIQFILVILEFHFLKKGYSGDEVYSYATANSSQSMNPLIDMNGTLHFNEWISSKQLFQAIVVSEDEVLNYKHINEILNDDAHPPLYFYLLHFFSTFFLGSFSWIPSIIINSVSIFFGQIFFYRLFLLLSKDRFQSVIAMLFFGCTTAVTNMMTFARNYTLLTTLTLIFTFYSFRSIYLQSHKINNTKSLLLAAFFLYLAALTQYLSILFGFFITLGVCIYFLIKRDIRSTLKTSLFMTISITLMILSFHEVLHQLTIGQTSMENATDYPFMLELRVSIHILFNEIFGVNTSVYPTMFSFWVLWGMIGTAIIYMIIRFLFRTDSWFTKFENRVLKLLKSIPQKINNQTGFLYLSLLFAVIAFVLITSYKFKMFFYYPNSNRYLFILYPYIVIIFLIPVFFVLHNNILRICFLIFLSCMSLITGKKTNTEFSDLTMKEAVEILSDSDVIVFVPNYPSANSSTLYLENCNKVFYTTVDSFRKNSNQILNGISNDRPFYMFYCWPTYNNANTNTDMLIVLKDLQSLGITTINEEKQYFGAEPVAGVGGHILFRLR